MADTQTPDVFDQAAAAPTPANAAPPPAQPAGSQQQGPDVFDQAEQASKTDGPPKVADKAESYWSWADKSLLDTVSGGGASDKLAHENEVGQSIINHEISNAHPFRAAMAQMYYGALKDTGNLALDLTTPKNLAIQAATMGKGIISQGVKLAANLYFAQQGGAAMIHDSHAALDFAENLAKGKLEGDPEALQRFLYGAAGITAGAGGMADSDLALRSRIQTKLGISGDLAGKVTEKVQQIESIRKQGVSDATGETLKAVQQAGDIFDAAEADQGQAKNIISNADAQAPIRVGQIVRDAVHSVYTEQARVNKPFEEMARDAKEPISDAQSMRATIDGVIKSHGVQDHEIPPKIYDALTERGKGSDSVNIMGSEVGPGDPLFEKLKAQGVLGDAGKGVSFSDATRVRGDLFDAAQSAKDSVVKNALFDAYDSVTKMQEAYAEKNGFADKYRAAKNKYRDFKRELGSGQMSDFTRAEDFKQQSMAPKVAKLMKGVYADSLRSLLKLGGVDVSPFDRLLSDKAAAENVLKTSPKQATKAASGVMQGGLKSAAEKIKDTEKQAQALGKANPVIPGTNDLDMQGKTTEEIRREAINHLVTNGKASGISNPMSMFMMVYGTLRMGMGSPFGIYPAVRGGVGVVKSQGGRLLRKPAYQDWLIRESGVDPSNSGLIGKLRKGFTILAKTADDLAKHPEKLDDEDAPQ